MLCIINVMQKIVNVLAIASSVVSLTVVGGGVYLYTQKDAIIESVKEKAMEAIMPSVGGGIESALPDVTGAPVPLPSMP